MATPNWEDKSIWTGDNLPIMRGMNSESVDLIYLDPPFNSKTNYAAPIGSRAAGAAFKDTWTLQEVDVAWLDLIEAKHPRLWRVIQAAMTTSDKSYLIYMAARLLEMKRILKPNGSLYLHCDPTMSHYLKLVMDAIWGRSRFQNEFIWLYEGREIRKTSYNPKHDILLFYSSGKESTFNWKAVGTPLKKASREALSRFVDKDGKSYLLRYKDGGGFAPKALEGSDAVYRQYTPEVVPPRDWVQIDVARKSERMGYPTQKPLALLEHIIRASSNEGDIVMDPFCGCATTMVAADALERSWVGIDISEKAVELVIQRIKEREGLFLDIISRTDIPNRTDIGKILPYRHKSNKKKLYGEQGGHCNGCGTHFEPQHLEVDHIIAVASGGTDHLDNLQLLCAHCNRVKGDRGQEYLISRLAT